MLHRSMLNWEWYQNVNTKSLFLHCLLKANHNQGTFEGEAINRGEFVTSLSKLAEETGLSVKQVRVSINHLKRTQEVASRSNSKYTVITIVNYDSYQSNGAKDGATEGQAKGKRRASEGQQYNNNNNNNNKKRKYIKEKKGSIDFELAKKMMFEDEDND